MADDTEEPAGISFYPLASVPASPSLKFQGSHQNPKHRGSPRGLSDDPGSPFPRIPGHPAPDAWRRFPSGQFLDDSFPIALRQFFSHALRSFRNPVFMSLVKGFSGLHDTARICSTNALPSQISEGLIFRRLLELSLSETWCGLLVSSRASSSLSQLLGAPFLPFLKLLYSIRDHFPGLSAAVLGLTLQRSSGTLVVQHSLPRNRWILRSTSLKVTMGQGSQKTPLERLLAFRSPREAC